VAINCAALPESILESELFGYVEGAFTGARKGGKAGVFEMAHGGTLLLDEVGEMGPMLQSRFLRAIEQREIMRLGDSRIIPVNVRLIASTHRNLKEMVTNRQFREDLYYRLNVLSLPVPTLKERGKDILQIAEKFLREFYDGQGKSYGIFSEEAAQLLLEYEWPGNIRQLRNAMERLSVMTAGGLIEIDEVSRALQIQDFTNFPGQDKGGFSPAAKDRDQHRGTLDYSAAAVPGGPLFFEEKAAYEREIIFKVLRECQGSKTKAAKKLGISRTTLWRKLQQAADG
jgi:transcriptional regulator with PAS, ATPase and Fis domain